VQILFGCSRPVDIRVQQPSQALPAAALNRIEYIAHRRNLLCHVTHFTDGRISTDIIIDMSADESPLFVRLPNEDARHLERAVAASGKSKRRLVSEAVREHLTDDGLVVGRAARDGR
jgi:hypothetical protein